MQKIGILTGGADCPGLNSVIRAVVRKSIQERCVVTGIKSGWDGLIENDMKILDMRMTSGILDRGGTILGTSRLNPPLTQDQYKIINENFLRSGIDALIAVGGEDTLKIALDLYRDYKMPVVGVPKSIDNALSGTDYAFGFDTAVNVATECIDRLHTTAESHHRIIVIEVMGRYTGWIALEAGIAGGADIVLVPEYPIDIHKVSDLLRSRHKRGKTFSIIVVSEGARIKGARKQEEREDDRRHHRVGKIGEQLANYIEDITGYETRVSVLGHIQRGGTPTAYDRVIGTQFGVKAVELIQEKKFGQMVSLKDGKIKSVDIAEAVRKHKVIDKDLYKLAQVFSAT
ncbi:MAG: 6-phosphofructokinase [Candidatus Omnitrophica bacterium]|nr:6-phosphofructokinase [Candidatus Omnitrophota bacterium]